MPDISRGKYIGKRLGEPPTDEVEHFMKCPACHGWFECGTLHRCWSTMARFRIRHRISRSSGRYLPTAAALVWLCPSSGYYKQMPFVITRSVQGRPDEAA